MGVLAHSTGIKPTTCRTNMSKDQGDQCSGVVSSSYVIAKSWQLKDHPRWVFRKNSMEFFVALLDYLYKSYSGYATISSWSHVLSFFQNVLLPDLVTWLAYLSYHAIYISVVQLDVRDQMFKCVGNSFLSGALTTTMTCDSIVMWPWYNNSMTAVTPLWLCDYHMIFSHTLP